MAVGVLKSEDYDRVRILTLNRPETLNAFSEELYDAAAEAMAKANSDPAVSVVVLTGAGKAYSSGVDVKELAGRRTGTTKLGVHGFSGFIDSLVELAKPLLCAVNGLAVGIGATMLAHADLVLMSESARVRCPFTDLGLSPEAASSYTFPYLLGRQAASWLLLSSSWLDAAECLQLGLAWKVLPDGDLLPETLSYARLLASKPLDSLQATKRLINATRSSAIAEARARETFEFDRLLGGPSNIAALRSLEESRSDRNRSS